jgi:hypothetical protein
VIRDICRCKHCGRYLDDGAQAVAVSAGLDANECFEVRRCLRETPFLVDDLGPALNDLATLESAWIERRWEHFES